MKDKLTIPDVVPKNVCRVCFVESGADIPANDCLEATLTQPREQHPRWAHASSYRAKYPALACTVHVQLARTLTRWNRPSATN